MDAKFFIVLIPVLVVPWIVLYIVLISTDKKVISNYKKLGEKYSLVCDYSKKIGMKTHPNANGMYRNRPVKIESAVRDSIEGQKVVPHTVLTVECTNSDGFTFNVVKRSKRNSLNYSAGSVMLDDNEFDDKFIIQTNNPDKIKKIFDFNTKFKLDQVVRLGFNGIISLNGNALQYIERDLLQNDESLMRVELVLHELCDVAEVMRYN
ncbi:MAG: hypothetical protein ABI543_00325 [Ignavibacteria bacterium]